METNKILILGSKGMLGGQLMSVFGNQAIGWDKDNVDVTNFNDLDSKIRDLQPSVVINCVAFNDVDGAEENKDLAYKLNSEAPKNMAMICKELHIPFVHFSTNYIFDGVKGEYTEQDSPGPLSVYAQSKHEGELEIQKNTEDFYIVRTAVLFGPKGESLVSKKSFVDLMLDLSANKNELKIVNDEINSLTYVVDLANAVRVLLTHSSPFGIYHFTNLGSASWYEFAEEIFKLKNKQIKLIPVSSAEFPRKAKRPQKSVLLNTKFIEFRPWQEALVEFLSK